jgi:hypothetical protein
MSIQFRSLLTAILTAAASHAQPVPQSNDSNAPPFTVTINLRPLIAKAGAPVFLDINLTNTSKQDIWLAGPKSLQVEAQGTETHLADWQGAIYIYYAKGSPVPPRKKPDDVLGGLKNLSGRSLSPGEFTHDHIPLDKHYDLTKLGQYTVWVQRLDPVSKVLVKSNTITLTVSENPPPEAPPFSIAISAEPSIVKLGEPVLLDINLTNTTGSEIPLSSRAVRKGEAANYGLDLRDAQGVQVSLRKAIPYRTGRDKIYSIPLPPGGSDHDSIPLDEYYDLSKPGLYTISAERSDPNSKTVAKSNTITVTVTAPSRQRQ